MSRKWIWGLGALLVGCDVYEGDIDTDEPEPWVWADLQITTDNDALVLDPKLAGEPSLSLTIRTEADLPDTGCLASVYVAEPTGRTWALMEGESFNNEGLSLTWSGRDDNGVPVDPGPVQISMDLDCSDRMKGFGELEVYIVRLGVVAIDFVGTDNVSLAYHKRELYLSGITELDGIPEYLNDRLSADEPADLDDALGQARQAVAHWEHPHIPPWRSGDPGTVGLGQHNFPAGYVAATPISMKVTLGEHATSARTGQAVPANGPAAWISGRPPIRVLADGFEAKDDGLWTPGATLQFDATSALPGTLGRHVESITWRYQAQLNGSWVDIPGTQTTTHPMYLLMGQSQVPDGRADDASPSVSWIGVLADLSDAVTGLPSNDVDVVMDRLRESLHDDPWFVYNPGDGAYSDYDGPYIYWDEIWVEMTDWLDRTDGIDLYCHSVACVLSSQANHLGIEAHYLTLGVNFRTHLTRAAGSSDWRRWSFNSHGITEVDGKVWDAAVDIDGDSDPNNQPVDPVSPMGMPVDAYFDLLTADDVDTVNFGRCLVY